jgi:hypothetical protein
VIVDLPVDVVVDGALDVSATFVVDADAAHRIRRRAVVRADDRYVSAAAQSFEPMTDTYPPSAQSFEPMTDTYPPRRSRSSR